MVASRQLVVAACEIARSHGVRPGMTLAEARALCPGLAHDDYRPDKDQRALEAFARWMVRFSPSVAVEPPDALLLDVTGSERLFGGFEQLNRLVAETLVKLNLGRSVGIAIAPTPGAAWAIASFVKNNPQIVAPENLREALSPLPIAALRLDSELVDIFRGLGVETVGQLIDLPRETLPARFGATVLERIDQALGRVAEPLLSVVHYEPIYAKLDFDEPIEALDMLEFLLKQLLREVVEELKKRGCGARKLVADFVPRYSPPIQKTIPLSRPTYDPIALFNLLRCALETVKGKEGFVGLRLSAAVFERMTDEQLALLDQESRAAESEWGHLVERLKVRMGEGTVLAPRVFESHLPEKAYRYAEACDGENPITGACALSPSSGTPGEGWGGGSARLGFPRLPSACSTNPHPNPSPEYQRREKENYLRLNSPSRFARPFSDRPEGGAGAIKAAPLRITDCALIKFKLPDPPQNEANVPGESKKARSRKKRQPPSPPDHAPRPRPLHLLANPVEVRCMASPSPEREGPPVSFAHRGAIYQITRAAGPERITGTWWEGRNKTRDYFDVEDPTGRRFWMFRVFETRKWYVHGVFDA